MGHEKVMQAAKPTDKEIVLTATFAAPRETVFAALTQPEHIRRWMKPTHMALVNCQVDLRVGGALLYVFQRPNGRKLEVRGVYQVVDRPRGFAYAETYDFSPLKVQVATALEAKGDTTVFQQTLLYATKQERDDDYDGVATSSAEVYAKLARYLAKKEP
jgi:uncharacterized protein YndB with AHSA1/START domain